MVPSDTKPLPKNYFGLKSYLRELESYERYAYFQSKTSIKELIWEGLPVRMQINIMFEYFTKPKNLETILIYTPEISYHIILKLLNKKPLTRKEAEDGEIYLYNNFIINNKCNFLEICRDKEELDEFFIFEDLLPILTSFNLTKLETKRKVIQPFISYIEPCLNFYGILEIENLIKIYRSQNIDSLPDQELRKLLKNYKHYYNDLVLKDDQIVLRVTLEAYRSLHQGIKDKPLYVPPKSELMSYGISCINFSPQFMELARFMIYDLQLEEDFALETISRVVAELHFGRNPLQIINLEINKVELELKNYYTELWFDFSNHFRTWFNRGHTPLEIDYKMHGIEPIKKKSSEKPYRILKIDSDQRFFDFADVEEPDDYDEFDDDEEQVLPVISKADKIGRNDLCPCGSGKKYKKCCGTVAD